MENLRPYVAKVAYFVASQNKFKEILEAIEEQTNEYSYRELCEGEGYYVEFEPQVLDNPNIPYLGNVLDLGADIVQVWGE